MFQWYFKPQSLKYHEMAGKEYVFPDQTSKIFSAALADICEQ
jgi:hypothetical protein